LPVLVSSDAETDWEAALGELLVPEEAQPAINITVSTKHRRREAFLPINELDILVSPLYYLLVVN
jgi:hypothetical protein